MNSNICFFTSIGDDLSLIQYLDTKYNFDIVCNYYGNNHQKYTEINNISIYCEQSRLSKFQSLKRIHKHISEYEYIFVFDDDAKIIQGDLNKIPKIMKDHNVDIASTAHDSNGKISHKIHIRHVGDHIFRYVTFIEMNFPIFNNIFLTKFINAYDGILSGWGIDHWYSQFGHNLKNKIIIDDIIIHNPKHSNKMNSLMPMKARKNQWEKHKNNFNMRNISPQNIEFIYK